MVDNLSKKEKEFYSRTIKCTMRIAEHELSAHVCRIKTPNANTYFEKSISISGEIVQSIKSFIGAHSYVNSMSYIRGRFFIGRYCSIGRRVTIGAGLHELSGLSSSPIFSSGPANRKYDDEQLEILNLSDLEPRATHTVVQSDVWIGDGAVILPGVAVGVGCAIGANAVVTRSVPPYSIVAGSPARLIRRRFPDEVCQRLLRSEWWEYPLDMIKKCNYGHIFEFLDSFEVMKHDYEKEKYETFMIDNK